MKAFLQVYFMHNAKHHFALVCEANADRKRRKAMCEICSAIERIDDPRIIIRAFNGRSLFADDPCTWQHLLQCRYDRALRFLIHIRHQVVEASLLFDTRPVEAARFCEYEFTHFFTEFYYLLFQVGERDHFLLLFVVSYWFFPSMTTTISPLGSFTRKC